MPYDDKHLAAFSLWAVAAAVVAGIFSGVWPLLGVAIALAILWTQGSKQGYGQHKPRCQGSKPPRGRASSSSSRRNGR